MKQLILTLGLTMAFFSACNPEYRNMKRNMRVTVNWSYNWSGSRIDLDGMVTNNNMQPVSNVSVQLNFYNYRNELITSRWINFSGTMAVNEQRTFSSTYYIDSATRVKGVVSRLDY